MLCLLNIVLRSCLVGVFEAGPNLLKDVLYFSLFELYFVGKNFLPGMERILNFALLQKPLYVYFVGVSVQNQVDFRAFKSDIRPCQHL